MTEYGGEVVEVEVARNRRTDGDDTHIRSCGYNDICLDSRVRDLWTLDYYRRCVRVSVGALDCACHVTYIHFRIRAPWAL